MTILCTLFAGINGFTLIKLIKFHRNQPQSNIPKLHKTCRFLLCNVLQENHEYSRILSLVEETDPELILLVETGKAWMEALEPLHERYPYHINQLWQEENFDIALFSRIPLESSSIYYFETATVPSVLVRFLWENQAITVIGTHPEPPKSYRQANCRNQQMVEIARFVRQHKGPLIVAGDLNMTSWSPFFHDFLRISGLLDSRLGHGIQPTWPTHLPPFMIPIDHILVTADIQIQRRILGEPVGSDHRPVILDFSIRTQELPHETIL